MQNQLNTTFIGELLKNRRKLLGFSLEQLAKHIDSSKSYVWELENSKIEPSGRKVFLLSMALGVPMEFFYGQNKGADVYAAYIGKKVIALMKEETPDKETKVEQ